MDQLQNLISEATTFVNNNQMVVFILVCVIIWLIYQCKSKSKETYKSYSPYGVHALEDGHYVIRGSRNNLYCSDDANGLFCNKDFAGPHEIFYIQGLGKEQYAIQSKRRSLYCSHTTTGIRCTSPTVGDNEVFNLRHVGKGKYSIQSDRSGKYCSDTGTGLVCDVPAMYESEFQRFEFIKVPYENIK